MVRPSTKALYGFAGMLALIGFIVYITSSYLNDLPTWEHDSAWRWFILGWISSAVACVLLMLPQWVNNSLFGDGSSNAAGSEQMKYASYSGAVVGVVSASLGVIGPSVAVGIGAVLAGMATSVLILGIGLNTTRKGRAMLAKRGE